MEENKKMDKSKKRLLTTAFVAAGVIEGIMFLSDPGGALLINMLGYTIAQGAFRVERIIEGKDLIDGCAKELKEGGYLKASKTIDYTFHPEKLVQNLYNWYVKK